MNPFESRFFIAGGTLASDAPSYVERDADRQLFEALERGEYCYVLTPRQMGKSSLMVRTAARLRQEGIRVAVLDLTAAGQNVSPEQWYDGILTQLAGQLRLQQEMETFWVQHERLGPLQRFIAALEQVVLTALTPGPSPNLGRGESSSAESVAESLPPGLGGRGGQIVLFIDEIDAVRNLPFSTDELFAAIRECYNRRAQDPRLRRLSFCLLGVAAPTDLIRDTRITPFNIGRRIELTDFTDAGSRVLAIGLQVGDLGTPGRPEQEARALLKRILYWTGGHPYLTQRLCQAVAATPVGDDGRRTTDHGRIGASRRRWSVVRGPSSTVDRLCAALFLTRSAREKDDNLIFARERLLRSEADRAAMLDLYRQVWNGKAVRDDETNPLCSLLKLSGIVSAGQCSAFGLRRPGRFPSLRTPSTEYRTPFLRVRNRVYSRVFDREWVLAHMPNAEVRRQKAAFRRGMLRSAAVASVLVLMASGLTGTSLYQYRLSQARLARSYVVTGMRLVEDGDALGSLPWLVEALKLEQGDAARAEMHRMRIGAALEQCPRIERAWFDMSCAVFSPDGRRIATGGPDGARIWDARTGEALTPLLAHPQGAMAVAFSPNGRFVATAGRSEVRLWDAASGRLAGSFKAPGDWTYSPYPASAAPTFSPDSRRFAAVGGSKVFIYDLARPRLTPMVLDHTTAVLLACFGPDGSHILVGGGDRARVWNASTGRPVTRPLVLGPWVKSGGFSPDGRRVLACGSGGARVWDVATGLPLTGYLKPSGGITHWAAYSADGGRIAAAGVRGTIVVWSAITGKEVVRAQIPDRIVTLMVSFSRDGRQLVTASRDDTVRLWNAATGKPVAPPLRSSSRLTGAVLSPNGRELITTSDGEVRLWDMAATHGALGALRLAHPKIELASFDPTGRRIITAGDDGCARLWGSWSGAPLAPPLRHHGPVEDAAFSPDGRRVATASRDATAQLWDADSGRPVAAPLRHDRPVTRLAFSRDSQRVVTCTENGTARLWEAGTGAPLGPPFGHNILNVVFNPDGRYIATASGDGNVSLWDAATGAPVRSPCVVGGYPGPLVPSFTPDGRFFVTSGPLGTSIWRTADAARVMILGTRGDGVYAATFSPDGRRVATAGIDGKSRLWDAATGQPATPPLDQGGWLDLARFSPNGRWLLTWCGHFARVWDAGTGEPLTRSLHGGGETPLGAARPGYPFSPDGHRFVALDFDRHEATVWQVPADNRPMPQLLLLSQVLSGHRLDATGGLTAATSKELRAAWLALQRDHQQAP